MHGGRHHPRPAQPDRPKATGDDRFKLVVAAADGIVRRIVDRFSENRPDQDPCNNNYVWIEHPNGEWTKYSHMIKNSVRRGAGLSEGLFVRAGRMLGIEGDVGCAHGQHLHFQVSDLGADSANARDPKTCNAASNLIACDVDLTFTAPAGAGSPRGTLTVTNTVDGPRTVKLEGQVQPGPILSATPSSP